MDVSAGCTAACLRNLAELLQLYSQLPVLVVETGDFGIKLDDLFVGFVLYLSLGVLQTVDGQLHIRQLFLLHLQLDKHCL